ncbi:DHA2 family efflux MFS transporter permease subunit [Noviherbaspirillum cavernae]|uniref:DHA2 family efflux MFS transporter permease subunit n=1 Tax=Noviherbaspirillum cavernae TaxID=2320862 RepID=A0A418WVK6_9BURK|nr:DHA2 family efflux MFS transporter permease subunit [Noviherbaspirillum cavernae]RJF96725.1 DHA2 family efflux MFS transporter permease subunit [Noviherbaspirillum cavernae]
MSVATSSACDEGVIQGTPAATPCSVRARPWVLATTILASGMAFIDGTVVNVALPALQNEFHASAASAQWVIESYGLLLTALLLVGGGAGDRFGRRRVFAIGVAVFALASVWCGLVGSIEQLIIARAMQGVGGALLIPGSLALISASFPEDIRGKAIGVWSGYTAITAALGPVIGGWLIEHLSWRYAFFINVPLALLILALAFRYVPESRNTDDARQPDWLGAVLASVGLGCFVYGVIESATLGWRDARVLGALAAAPVAVAGFIAVERRHPAPMLPLHLFRSRNFSGANLLTLLLYSALGGGLYFFPLNLIQVQGYSATAAGAALLPFVLCMFLLSRWAGGLVDRYGAKRPLVIGPAIAALGFAMFALPGIGGSYWSTFFPAVLVLGFGMTVSVAPLTTTVMNALDSKLAGVASGVNNAVSRAAALLAIAVLGIVMSHGFNHAFKESINASTVTPPLLSRIVAQQDKLAAIEVPAEAAQVERDVIKTGVAASFVYGFRWVMLLSALLALASSLIAWRMIEDRPQRSSLRAGPGG